MISSCRRTKRDSTVYIQVPGKHSPNKPTNVRDSDLMGSSALNKKTRKVGFTLPKSSLSHSELALVADKLSEKDKATLHVSL